MSVARFAPPGTRHRIIVPRADVELFRSLSGPNVDIVNVEDILPRHMVKVFHANVWVNVRAPWPPVRGWITQQIVKLTAAAESPADRVLLVDSDLVFVRQFSVADFGGTAEAVVYRKAGAVHAGMPRHITWDAVARDLIGAPAAPALPLADYICWPCLWNPAIVRELIERIQQQRTQPWQTVIGRQLHFSEMVLYGIYVDEVLAQGRPVIHINHMRCANHHAEVALDEEALQAFLGGVARDDVAVMISAKSGTELSSRRQAIAQHFGTGL
ncbi:DUF6492 family protein (plasmid) [Coraliomargarita sp. W4R53]